MRLRLHQHLKLQQRFLEQQSGSLREKRSALERELAVTELLSELIQDTELQLSVGMSLSGISLDNNGQFKSLLSKGMFLRQQQSTVLQEQCRQMTERLLISRKQVSHLEAVLDMIHQTRQRHKQRVMDDEWFMQARGSRRP